MVFGTIPMYDGDMPWQSRLIYNVPQLELQGSSKDRHIHPLSFNNRILHWVLLTFCYHIQEVLEAPAASEDLDYHHSLDRIHWDQDLDTQNLFSAK